MDLVFWFVAGIQALLLLSAFPIWNRVSALIRSEQAAISQLEDFNRKPMLLAEGQSPGIAFFATPLRQQSMLHERWTTILSMTESAGGVPFDQSFLDDELEASFEDTIAPLRSKAGLAVLVGLAGTLGGLSFGVKGLESAMPKAGQNLNLVDFAESMGHTISGFGTAFYSALAGVLSAIALTALAAHLQNVSFRFVAKFRQSCRTHLFRLLPQNAHRVSLLEQMNSFARALRALEKRLPDAASLQDLLGQMQDLNAKLEESATGVILAYERSAQVLERPNTVSEGLNRIEILLAEHAKNTHGVIEHTLQAIELSARKQIEFTEELARQVVDAPMEVSAARLFVTDRPEFQKFNKLLDQRLENINRIVTTTQANVKEVAERKSWLASAIERLRR